MLVAGLVSTMTVGDDGVEEVLENLVGLLVTGDAAHSHDEGVSWREREGQRLSARQAS